MLSTMYISITTSSSIYCIYIYVSRLVNHIVISYDNRENITFWNFWSRLSFELRWLNYIFYGLWFFLLHIKIYLSNNQKKLPLSNRLNKFAKIWKKSIMTKDFSINSRIYKIEFFLQFHNCKYFSFLFHCVYNIKDMSFSIYCIIIFIFENFWYIVLINF